MNKIFVAFKPKDISSNAFLQRLKKKYGVKKAGYSGTLDPFAKGVLIVAFGSFTRLFRFLKKEPKIYEATLWLGAKSVSLDDRNIEKIKLPAEFAISEISRILSELKGELEFTPPKFSAKKVAGKRAYKMAAKGEEFELSPCKMSVFDAQILSYNHPFLNLRLSVSEGAYIRSYAQIFAAKLGVEATLSALTRVSEGNFAFENEKPLDILSCLNLPKNEISRPEKLENGTKIALNELKIQKNGTFVIESETFFSIITITNGGEVAYLLNKVEKC